MAKKAATKASSTPEPVAEGKLETLNLAQFFSRKATYNGFDFWIVGDTPILCHAWSEKARRQMLEKQVKSFSPGKEARDPGQEFIDSLYEMPDGKFGFPAMAVKNAIVSVAHKDKGIPRTVVQGALFIKATWTPTRPALAGAQCNMPLLRLWGSDPVMREDMVRIGAGARKTANLAYRGEFAVWALHIQGKFNASALNEDVIGALVNESGTAVGVGDWRTEKKGMFGSFHLADANESEQWAAFAAGRGALPVPPYLQEAAE